MGDLVNGSITNLRDRRPWFDMPTCQSCHQNGERYTSAITVDAVNNTFAYRSATDTRFATKPNTPNLLPGLSMYRFSGDHGQLQCAACQTRRTRSSQARPANSANDNLRAIEAQGYAAAIRECTAAAPGAKSAKGGPHGMHYVGQAWVTDHHDVVTSSNKGDC